MDQMNQQIAISIKDTTITNKIYNSNLRKIKSDINSHQLIENKFVIIVINIKTSYLLKYNEKNNIQKLKDSKQERKNRLYNQDHLIYYRNLNHIKRNSSQSFNLSKISQKLPNIKPLFDFDNKPLSLITFEKFKFAPKNKEVKDMPKNATSDWSYNRIKSSSKIKAHDNNSNSNIYINNKKTDGVCYYQKNGHNLKKDIKCILVKHGMSDII